jgi:hypothetical protein
MVLLAVSVAVAAFAAVPARAASGSEYRYSMHLSVSAATVAPGGATKTVITFEASRRLYGLPVDLSVTGLPAGATATFTPPRPRVGGHSTLTVTTAPATPAGAATITVSAIINLDSSDPIGTTAPFDLTVSG